MPVKNQFYKQCHGWLTYEQLYEDAVNKITESGIFVEVGCWQGQSACFLATYIKENNKDVVVHCVDNWCGEGETSYLCGQESIYDIFLNNIKKCNVDDIVVAHKTPSLEGAKLFEDKSLDFVFIDAAHDYTSVCNDIRAWLPKVKTGGVLAGHDYDSDGVKRAVHDTLGKANIQELNSQSSWWYDVC